MNRKTESCRQAAKKEWTTFKKSGSMSSEILAELPDDKLELVARHLSAVMEILEETKKT